MTNPNPNANANMYYVRNSDGLAYCFSPVPLIADSKQVLSKIKDGISQQYAIVHTLGFTGTLLPNLPSLSGVADDATCLELLDRKSDQLSDALSEDYGNLLIVDSTGYPVLNVFPRVTSLEFPESRMVFKRDYNLNFEYTETLTDCKVSDFGETWDFAYQDDDTIAVTHSINAVGIPETTPGVVGSGALANAQAFVLARANTLDRTQYAFLTSPYLSSIVDADNLTEYNHVRSESIDTTAGSYSINETWILSSGNYKDDRTIDSSFELDEYGQLVETRTVNGTVLGYGDTTIARYNNAISAFVGVIAPEIGFNAVSGIATKSRSDNRFAGTISYSVSYGRVIDNVLQDRQIQRSLQRNEDGTVTQSVTTSARVRLDSPSGITPAIDYCYANNYPINSYVEPFFTASLSGNVESVSIQRDELNKSFSLTRSFRDQNTSLYREEYQTSREINLETATTTITVNGTVQGLAAESGTNTLVRFAAASGAFYNIITNQIRPRALEILPSGTCLSTNAVQQTLGYNKLNGTITYSYKFDNRFLTSNPAIRDEKIDVSYNLPADVIAVIPIPGKSTGPILQDQETNTGYQKSLKIQYTMNPSGDMCGEVNGNNQALLELAALTESNILVNNNLSQHSRGEKPTSNGVFKTADNYTFNRQTFVFTRSVTWQYIG